MVDCTLNDFRRVHCKAASCPCDPVMLFSHRDLTPKPYNERAFFLRQLFKKVGVHATRRHAGPTDVVDPAQPNAKTTETVTRTFAPQTRITRISLPQRAQGGPHRLPALDVLGIGETGAEIPTVPERPAWADSNSEPSRAHCRCSSGSCCFSNLRRSLIIASCLQCKGSLLPHGFGQRSP